jgi:uncharacterized membrane protein
MSTHPRAKVSLVMTTFNESRGIDVLFASILEQSVWPDEVVVCDAGSKDSTVRKLEAWRERLPMPIVVIVEPGANISRGRNVAIHTARNKVIAVTDGGCRLSPDWLESITAPLADDTAVVYGSTTAVGKSLVGRLFAAFHHSKTNIKEKTLAEFSSRSVIFTKEAWSNAGGYPEDLTLAGEDTLFFIQLAKVAKSAFVGDASVFWNHGVENLRQVYRMHRRNSIGAGEAMMFPGRYAVLIGIYLTCLLAVLVVGIVPLATLEILVVLVAFLSRATWPVYQRTKLARAIFMMPVIMAVRDFGMMAGFVIGLRHRLGLDGSRAGYLRLIGLNLIYFVSILVGKFWYAPLLWVATLLAAVVVLWMPGYLLLKLLRANHEDSATVTVLSVGASVFILFATGLVVNTFLPLLGDARPLEWPVILATAAITNAVLLGLSFAHRISLGVSFPLPQITRADLWAFGTPAVFLVSSILGAMSLNNGGTNWFTMFALGGVAVYVAAILLCRTKLRPSLFPYALFMICLSLVLMVSLRSWQISGHDILSEYSVFELTKSHARWNIGYFRDAYNACLSITLLPTMLAAMMPKISDQYILRIVYQVLFSFTTVAFYQFARRFISFRLAFLAVLFFMSQSPFLRDFAYMSRQELGTLFFVLMLLTLTMTTFKRRTQMILAMMFAMSMIVSHYSTTYIAIGMMVLAQLFDTRWMRAIVNFCLDLASSVVYVFRWSMPLKQSGRGRLALFAGLPPKNAVRARWLPGWKFIGAVVLCAFLWNSVITQTANNIKVFGALVVETMLGHDPLAATQNGLSQQLNGPVDAQNNSQSITLFQKTSVGSSFSNDAPHYPTDTLKAYSAQINTPFLLNPSIQPKYSDDIGSLGTLIQTVMKVFILIGALAWLLYSMKKKILNGDLGMFMVASVLIMAAAILIPAVTANYDVLRTYQQLLIVLAIPATAGGFAILSRFFKKSAFVVIVGLFCTYYLFVSPFIPQIVGSGYAHLQLNNYGLYYNLYYTHATEVASIDWLTAIDNNNQPIYSDWFANKKIAAFSGDKQLWMVANVLPANITKGSYVYADYTNTVLGTGYDYFNSVELNYAYPTAFLSAQKNLIYTNGTTGIYQ